MRELRNDVTAWGGGCARYEEASSSSKGDGRNKEREGMIELHDASSGKRVAVEPQFITEIREEDGGTSIWLCDGEGAQQVSESYDEVMKLINEAEQRPLPFDLEGKS